MARPIRIEYEGAVYHVTIRGNERKSLFKTDADRERFINALSDSVERYSIRLYLYILMQNHAHFVLATPCGNLSRFMQRFQTAYTVYYNKRHRRSGHLMQGRFGASLVEEDRYILKLSRYVHLNPVFIRANKSKSAAERLSILHAYRWSSYLAYIGKCDREDFVDYSPVLAMMEGSKRTVKSQYRRFVEAGIADIDAAVIYAKQRSPLCIGSYDYVDRVETRYHELADRRNRTEEVSFTHQTFALDQETVLSVVCDTLDVERSLLYERSHHNIAKSIAAMCLCKWSGCSQFEVGKILRIGNCSSVSTRLKHLRELLQTDKTTNKLQIEIDLVLSNKQNQRSDIHIGSKQQQHV
jgi:REP element-mobilizing transposase RayT